MKCLLIVVFLLNIIAAPISAQDQHKVDSLTAIIKENGHDTSVAAAYVRLANLYVKNNTDTMIPLCKRALKIVTDSDTNDPILDSALKNIQAYAYNQIGYALYYKDSIEACFEYFEKNIEINLILNNKKGLGTSYNNLAFLYEHQGKLEKAQEYYHNSIKIREEINDQDGIVSTLNNLGMLYSKIGDVSKAESCFLESIEKCEEDDISIMDPVNNLAGIYRDRGEEEKAMSLYEKNLKMSEKHNDKKGILTALHNLGNGYLNKELWDKGLVYFRKSLKYAEDLHYTKGIIANINSIGVCYEKSGNRKKALNYFKRSLVLAEKIRSAEYLMRTNEKLAMFYKMDGQYKTAFTYLDRYQEIKDSLSNVDLKQQVLRKELQFDYELKHAADSIRNQELQKVKDAELKMQQAQIETEQSLKYGLLLILLLVGIFSVYLYTRFRIIRQQKYLIEEQKKVVDEWKKDMTDSINYAKKIQDAQLTSNEYFKKALPESFVLYSPKDIVSGDYYWVYENNNDQVFFTVADCTGHGVPGAFMSMIGISLLNELIIENGLKEPDKVLFEMRGLIIKSLSQGGDVVEAKDGMDMALCRWDKKENRITFSGAFNSLYVIRNGKLVEYKSNRRPVGYFMGKDIPFTKEEVALEKGDMVYIFSDGFADQFGGSRGKKYSTRRYKELLLMVSTLSCGEQRTALDDELSRWMGEEEQVDDVCVMGVRF